MIEVVNNGDGHIHLIVIIIITPCLKDGEVLIKNQLLKASYLKGCHI